jgi:endonuclease YncB( thermonuclease family)
MKYLYFYLLLFLVQHPLAGKSLTNPSSCIVKFVIDGDTFITNKGDKVRLIGVDAPETHHPELPTQHFGKEATEFLKSLILGKKCSLKYELENKRDKYNRLLAYVYCDGKLINAEMISQGYSFTYTLYDFSQRTAFLNLEKRARYLQLGLWHLTLRDGRIANIASRYEQLNLEGRKKFDQLLDELVKKHPLPKEEVQLNQKNDGIKEISWKSAKKNMNKYVKVHGKIVTAKNTGKVCLLNFSKNYSTTLTLVIFSSKFSLFNGNPEDLF